MKNLFLTLALVFSGTLFCQETNVTITLKGEKDAEWMCGITQQEDFGISHQAVDCYDGHLFIDSQTIEINVTEPGSYCVRMKSSKYDKVSMVYFTVEHGDNYELFKRIRNDVYKL